MQRNQRILGLLAVLLAVVTVPAFADEGRTPLYEPTTITMPGSYVVTRNISSATGPVLTITAEGVSVDLNGFELNGGDPAAPVVLFDPPDTEADHRDHYFNLFGGNIVGGVHGVQVTGAERRNVHLHHLQVGGAADAAVRVHNTGNFHAEMVTVVESLVGFDLMCPMGDTCGPAMMDQVNVHASRGVQCSGVTCSVEDSSFVVLGGMIRLTDAPNSHVQGNNAMVFTGGFNPQPEPPARIADVVRSGAANFEGNSFQGAGLSNGSHDGIVFDAMSPHGRIVDNLVSMAGDDGIRVLGNDTLVAHNAVVGAGGTAIVVDGTNNFLQTNKVSGCGGFGMDFQNGNHVMRGNILLGNDGGAMNISAAAVVRDAGGNEM